jgi:hypothetical protein
MFPRVQLGPRVLGILNIIDTKILHRVQLVPNVLGIYFYERPRDVPSGSIRPRSVRGFINQTSQKMLPVVQQSPLVLGD